MVAPGFIDLHSHGQTPENYRFKARDGVTTALEMEVGVSPVAAWYREREGKALINFGATSGELPARMAVMHDTGKLLPRDKAVERATTEDERRQIRELIGRGLDEGALGIGMGIAYEPLATRDEVFQVFRFAAERRATIFVHMRNSGPVEPGVVDALQEVIADAAAAGASVHVVHITSMGLREDAAVPRDDRGRARAAARHHDRGVSVHRGHDGHLVGDFRGGLAGPAGRHQPTGICNGRRPANG